MSELLCESNFCNFPSFCNLPPFSSCLEMRETGIKPFCFHFFNQRRSTFFLRLNFYRELELFFWWHTPIIFACSFFSLGLVVLIGDILTVPLGIQQVHWLLLVRSAYSYKLGVFSENVTYNKDLNIESGCIDYSFFPVHTVCNACTGNTAGMLNCDHAFTIISGSHADRSREICLLVLWSC